MRRAGKKIENRISVVHGEKKERELKTCPVKVQLVYGKNPNCRHSEEEKAVRSVQRRMNGVEALLRAQQCSAQRVRAMRCAQACCALE